MALVSRKLATNLITLDFLGEWHIIFLFSFKFVEIFFSNETIKFVSFFSLDDGGDQNVEAAHEQYEGDYDKEPQQKNGDLLLVEEEDEGEGNLILIIFNTFQIGIIFSQILN